jgi:hypothetical protein
MIGADELRGIRRRLREAEEGSTQEKVSARAAYAQDIRALLGALEESGVALAIARIDELEGDLHIYREREAIEAARKAPRPPAPRMRGYQPPLPLPKREIHDGKLAACGKDE